MAMVWGSFHSSLGTPLTSTFHTLLGANLAPICFSETGS
jgi:hypothetical protein